MKLVTYKTGTSESIGALIEGTAILDLPRAVRRHQERQPHTGRKAASFPKTMQGLIEGADWTINIVEALLKELPHYKDSVFSVKEEDILAPLPRPTKNVYCVGRNYLDHVAEGDRAQNRSHELPIVPQFFTKPPTAVSGPYSNIKFHSDVTSELDYEIELALIIGRRGTNISEAAALDHIFGFSIINDVTARDLQRRHGQWFKGKALDGSCIFGPCIVPRTHWIENLTGSIKLWVNGQLRQSSTTDNMIFGIPKIIASLSAGLTLEPGDIIATGTPSGVGYAMTPPHFLRGGDTVLGEIEGIGHLKNVVEEVRSVTGMVA